MFVEGGGLCLFKLMDALRHKGYNLNGFMVAFFSKTHQGFVYCGNDPVDPGIVISVADQKPRLGLRVRKPVVMNVLNTFAESASTNKATPVKNSRRTKERRIGNIIDMVRHWRTLYKGITTPSGEIIKKSLEDAASEIGISKKSLDDYLLQLRSGKKYGFNFDNHKEDKVGILRSYVKKHKKFESTMKGFKNTSDTGVAMEIEKLRKQKGTSNCKDIKCCYP